ncbi:MAG: SPASM domain-containing protein [Chloroflexi bacterium]|nr:SPASM domain-containing protein [Chloroflexota bacterium]
MDQPLILTCTSGEFPEQDCACPDGGFEPLTPHTMDTFAAWQIAPRLYRAPLPERHQLVFNPAGFSNVVVLNTPAQNILDAFALPQRLDSVLPSAPVSSPEHANAVRSLMALGLIRPTDAPASIIRSRVKTLTAWLHVTNACNLRCTYCYIHKTNHAMTEEIGRAAVDAVFRSAVRHRFQAVKLKYAGGEATLNFDLVRTLHAHARARKTESGLELREVVLSNGVTLTRAMIEFLRDENIRLMISLDGVGAAHDKQRVFASGRGSFSSVAHAIDRAITNGLSPHLSITVTAHNADTLTDAVHFAIDRDLPFNLNFYRENQCATPHTELAAAQARLVAGMQAAFAVIETRLPKRRLIDGLMDRSSFAEPHEYACGAGHNYMVIDERGGVARCQMEIERPLTSVMAEDPLAHLRNHRRGFQNVPVTEKEGCKNCEWRFWCAGGCALLTWRATGRTDVQSPYCNVYHALYPQVVRLEGLRLLKYAAMNA